MAVVVRHRQERALLGSDEGGPSVQFFFFPALGDDGFLVFSKLGFAQVGIFDVGSDQIALQSSANRMTVPPLRLTVISRDRAHFTERSKIAVRLGALCHGEEYSVSFSPLPRPFRNRS